MRFDLAVKKLRELKGLTQTQLAAIIGCSPFTISRWERGKTIPARYFKKFEECFGKDIFLSLMS